MNNLDCAPKKLLFTEHLLARTVWEFRIIDRAGRRLIGQHRLVEQIGLDSCCASVVDQHIRSEYPRHDRAFMHNQAVFKSLGQLLPGGVIFGRMGANDDLNVRKLPAELRNKGLEGFKYGGLVRDPSAGESLIFRSFQFARLLLQAHESPLALLMIAEREIGVDKRITSATFFQLLNFLLKNGPERFPQQIYAGIAGQDDLVPAVRTLPPDQVRLIRSPRKKPLDLPQGFRIDFARQIFIRVHDGQPLLAPGSDSMPPLPVFSKQAGAARGHALVQKKAHRPDRKPAADRQRAAQYDAAPPLCQHAGQQELRVKLPHLGLDRDDDGFAPHKDIRPFAIRYSAHSISSMVSMFTSGSSITTAEARAPLMDF